MRTVIAGPLCLWFALFVLSCSSPAAGPGERVATEQADLYVNSSWTWAGGEVPVCWEDTDPAYEGQREWVRQAVESTWQREAHLHFWGWGHCDWYLWTNPQVRIRVADERPYVVNLGTLIGHQYNGMTLNFAFQNWPLHPNGRDCSTLDDQQYCIEITAVHEFGHALGFAHEQSRPDAPSCIAPGHDDGGDQGGDWLIGPYDDQSVMNYCNISYNTGGVLSPGDIVGVQTVYGKRHLSIVGVDSLCLSAPGGPGADTTMDHCAPAPEQEWSMSPVVPTFPVLIGNRNAQVLDAWASGTTDGTPIRTWSENQPDTPNQEWDFHDVRLRGYGGRCLDTADATTAPGTLTGMFSCLDSQASQRWSFTSAGEIRTSTGECLDAQWGSSADGTPVWIWDCNGTPAQQWIFFYGQILGPGFKCLTVAGGTDPGTGLQLQACNHGLKQAWSIAGPIRTALPGGLCINAATSFLGIGPPLLWNCSDVPAEAWEFFP
jgi:hypothetical protein